MNRLSFLGIFAILTITALVSLSCERDDICVEGTLTTPLLVIEFFDAEIFTNTTEDVLKPTSDLWVEAVDPNTVIDNGVEVIVDPIQGEPQAVSTISIPLRTAQDATEYRFIKDYALDEDGNQLGNEDIITFNYSREEIFLSRACGFITNYTLNETDGVVLTTDGDTWISSNPAIVIENTIVEDETVTHVKIYH
ncbi:MAG: DUF6452 family protein [Bacteroidota bacterium]